MVAAPALDRPLLEIADALTRAFEGYLLPAAFTPALLLYTVRCDAVDLAASRLFYREGNLVGAALIARRGSACRLAAFGVTAEARRQGIGREMMAQLLTEARDRGEREMVLEVIEQNTGGVRLYQTLGFQTQRRLKGYTAEPNAGLPDAALTEVDISELARTLAAHAAPDLPWQISGAALAQMGLPTRGYRLGSAYAALADPDAATITLRALLVLPGADFLSEASRLIRALQARFPTASWRVPILFPEESMSELFSSLDFQTETLSQLQMSLSL